MAEMNPTVVITHLDDDKLRKSIDSLVNYVDEKFQSMVSTTTTKVGEIQTKLNELSQIKVDSNGSADGGSSKRAKAIQSETQSLESLQIQYDKVLGALQMAQRQERVFAGKDIWSLTREELDKYSATLQRVSELEKSLASIRGQMSLAIAEKGQFAPTMKEYTDGLVRTSEELKKMSAYYKELEKDSQRAFRVDLAKAMKMPATTIDEIRSKWAALRRLIEEPSAIGVFTPNQIANAKSQLEDLWGQLSRNRALQEQINADTQQQIVATNLLVEAEQKYGVEIAHTAKYFRESAEGFQRLNLASKNGLFTISNPVYYNEAKSIEEQLLVYKALNKEANLQLEVEKAIAIERQKSKQAAQESVAERQRYNEQRQLEKTNIGEYDELRATIASVIGVEQNQVRMADIENDSYKELSATLKQLKEAYNSLQSSGRKSETGENIIAEIQAIQHGMQEIQKTMSRPVSLDAALNLPEKTIDQITYKVQMLRSYIQNLDVVEEHGDIRKVEDAIERLNKKSKDAQQSTRKVLEEVNQIKFDNIAKMPTESLEQVSAKFKEVKQYIIELRNQPIVDEKNIKRAEALYDRLLKEIDKLHKVQGTESNVNRALKMQAQTLNEIAEKTQRLQAIRANLDPTKQADLIQRVNSALTDLGKRQNEIMGKNQQLEISNNALTRSWNYMKNRLAFYFTVGASTQFVKNLIEVRSQYEMNERALGILIDSAERGTQIFNELSQMALVSPYTLIELSTAAKQLTAYDVAAKDVVDTTRRLADMASAVGIPIERLTYALGQVKAFGYLNSRDARMFLNAGIPLVKSLADHYTELEGKMVSVGDVYDRMKKKAIGYNDVMAVITEMTDEGGKFFDFQAKMADTLKVQLANLTLAWNNMLNDIGKSEQGVLVGGIKGLKELFLQWNSLQRVITDVAVVIGIAKAAQVVLNISMGKGMATINQSILAYKNKQATMLEYQQLTRKLTADEMALVATRNRVTSADYKQILSSKGVTKANALMMASFQKTNIPLMLALRRMNLLTAAELRNASVGKGVVLAIKGIGVALKGVWATMTAMAPSLLITGLIMGAVEALQYYSDQAEKTRESNKNIADGAKEASDALKKFIAENKKGLGNISEDEAQKVWMALRDQIELSSAAAESFVTELLKEEDINKRLEKGFDYADRIQRSTNALAGLKDIALKVSQDSVFDGLFGEGLAEDLEDYIETVQKLRSRGYDMEARNFDRQEAEREMVAFADDVEKVLRDRLGDAGLADPVQVREAVERIKKEVKAANPQIKGEVEKYFDVDLDQLLGERLGGVYDKSYSLQKMLIERIKRDSGAALKGLSDDILDTSKELDDNVVDAIEKAFEKLEKDLPAEQRRLLADLQNTFNENPLTLRYILKEAADVDIRDAIQKDFDEHFGLGNANKPIRPKKPIMADFSIEGTWATDMIAYGKAMEKYNKEMEVYNSKMATYDEEKASRARVYAEFNKQEGEDRVKWGKRLLDAEKEANEQAKAAAHTQQQVKAELGEQAALTDERYKAAVKDEKAAVERANAARTAYNYEHLYNEEKTKGSSGTKKDEFGDALAKEVQYISDIQKRFNEYQKMGVDAQHALTLATDEYGKSIIRNNAILQKYGVKTLSSEQLATMPLQKVRDFYQEQLNGSISSAKGVEVLEKAIANLNVEITKIDYKRITDGLNNELGKLKDEYELAVELDANPELGGIFMDIFDIDPNNLPNTIDAYATNVMEALNRSFEKQGKRFRLDTLSLTDDDLKAYKAESEKQMGAISEEDYKIIEKYAKEIRNLRKKDREDTLKQTQELQYKLGDVNEKIAIESKKLSDLQVKYQKETNNEKKRLLDLQIKDQKNTIAKLGEEVMQMLPTYKSLFNSIAEHSAVVTRRIAKQWKGALVNAVKNPDGTYTITDPKNGKKATITKKEYGNQIDKVNGKLRETMSTFAKIREAFTKGEDGEIDVAKGLEYIAQEAQKAAEGLRTVADIVATFGRDDESAETLNDIATTMEGVATAAQGYAKIQSGDIIGGATDMVKGTWQAVSTWLDNGDKKISKEIEKSERQVRKLELAYIDLEHAIEEAYGTETIGAQKAAIANKELQLAELKRQLTLEQSRKKKHQDQDRIIELQKQIKELEYDIKKMTKEIVNDLLGISSIGSFAEDLVSSMISAFKNGEDYMLTFEESFDKMIDNIIMKSIVSRVVAQYLDAAWADIDKLIKARTESIAEEQAKFEQQRPKDRKEMVKAMRKAYEPSQDEIDAMRKEWERNMSGKGYISSTRTDDYFKALIKSQKKFTEQEIESYANGLTERSKQLEAELKKASVMSDGDIHWIMSEFEDAKDSIFAPLVDELKKWYTFGESASEDKLSALQQGIQGITEDTAGALEGYMNGVSQQVYLQSDLLTQIRDAVVMIDSDTQMGVQAQMLLQLQQTYAVQMAIQNILQGWSNPSGMAMRVEMVN